MVYLINSQVNELRTDSWLNYIPELLNVYLDDVLIGEFINESTSNQYFIVTIQPELLVDFQLKEHKLRWFADGVLLKEELLVVKSTNQLEIKSINKSNQIIMYGNTL